MTYCETAASYRGESAGTDLTVGLREALDLRRRDEATARALRAALGETGDLRGRLGLSGEKCLFVASPGGHIAQLEWLASQGLVHEDSLWMTARTPQTEALLEGRRVSWLPYVPPRGWRELVPASRKVVGALAKERFSAVVSTGASLALPALVGQRAKGGRAVYVESISRVQGPSVTGRALMRVPGVERYTQHAAWQGPRWTWAGSVLDGLTPAPRLGDGRVRSVFVTLGTIQPYRFDRLVDAVLAALPVGVEVTWQLGCTDRQDLPGEVHAHLPAERMRELLASSDLVVSHAGVATALQLVANGTPSVPVPRRAAHGEHVDDHQTQIASLFGAAGLVTVREADEVGAADLTGLVPVDLAG